MLGLVTVIHSQRFFPDLRPVLYELTCSLHKTDLIEVSWFMINIWKCKSVFRNRPPYTVKRKWAKPSIYWSKTENVYSEAEVNNAIMGSLKIFVYPISVHRHHLPALIHNSSALSQNYFWILVCISKDCMNIPVPETCFSDECLSLCILPYFLYLTADFKLVCSLYWYFKYLLSFCSVLPSKATQTPIQSSFMVSICQSTALTALACVNDYISRECSVIVWKKVYAKNCTQ